MELYFSGVVGESRLNVLSRVRVEVWTSVLAKALSSCDLMLIPRVISWIVGGKASLI